MKDGLNESIEQSEVIAGKIDSTTGDTAAVQVVRLVTAAADKPVTDLEPLYWSMECDALESLLQGESPIRISSEYDGHTVVIHSDRTVKIYRIEG